MYRLQIFSMIKKFLAIFITQAFNYIFTVVFTLIFSKREKSITFCKYFISGMNSVSCHFYILHLITKVMFILSSISSEFWSVNHTSMYENSELKVFKNIIFLVKYVVIDQMTYYEQIYTRPLNLDDNRC